MINQMDRKLLWGINYAKPHTPAASRQLQADKMAAAYCQSTRDGIDLALIWTGPGQYNWSVPNLDIGVTYDQAVDISIAKGIEVVGLIATTPYWALGLERSGTATGAGNLDGTGYLDDTSTNFGIGTYNNNYDVIITSGPGAGQSRLIVDTQPTRLTVSPKWQTIPPAGSSYEIRKTRHKWPPLEQYAQDFINACQEVATHFLGRIRYFEFWNEENLGGWHEVNPAEYTTWLKRCYQGVKAGNPNALVAVGGLDGAREGQRDYLNAIYDNGGKDYFEAVGVHPYDPAGGPLDIYGVHNFIRPAMVAHNDSAKSIWLTEYGGWQVPPLTQEQQRDYLLTSLGYLDDPQYYYITQASYHTIADTDGAKFGLCDGNLNPRLAYYAFRDFAAPRTPRWETKAPVTQMV